MEARRYGLGVVLGIQSQINADAAAAGRSPIDLINADELARIEALIAANTWPDGWDGTEPRGDVLIPQTIAEGIEQPLLLTLEESA
jgi:DNA sulfur modification protein DndC